MARTPSQPNLIDPDSGPKFPTRFWLAIACTGILAGLTGGAMMRLLFFIEHTAWQSNGQTFLQAVSHASHSRLILNLTLAGILVGVLGTLLRKFFKPGGDAENAIWLHGGKVPLLSTILKAIVAIVTVGLGTSLGRESPIKQAGGAIAARFSRWINLSPDQQKLLVACGVGAGMASAYNVPLGGAVFAIEVLIGSLCIRNVLPALVTSGIATTASWLLLPDAPVYEVPEYHMSKALLMFAFFLGPLLGFVAVLIIRLIAWAEGHQPKGKQSIFLPIMILALLGILAIQFPQLLGNGKDTVELAFTNQIVPTLLLTLATLKLITTIACLRSGARGGLFTPVMTVGALLGGALGNAWSLIWPGTPILAPGSYAVVGSCALLAATTQGPISSLVLVLELTRHMDATMVPMLFAVTGATMVVRCFESRSIYSARAPLK